MEVRVDGFEISRHIEEVGGYLLGDVHDVPSLFERSFFIQDVNNAFVEERESIVDGFALGQEAGLAAHDVLVGVPCKFLDGVNDGAQARMRGDSLRFKEALTNWRAARDAAESS